jgi:DNA-binding beta-propeller fold protein YncE
LVPGDVVYSAGKVYIADYGTQRIRQVDLKTGVISTVAGGGTRMGEGLPATKANLLLPEGIAVEGHKVLYIADNISNKVWKVDLKTAILQTFAGGSQPRSSSDDGSAVSAHLNLPSAGTIGPGGLVYIAEFGGRTVRVVDAETGTMRTLHGVNGAEEPLNIAVTSLDATPQGLFLLTYGSDEVCLFDLQRHACKPLPQIDGLPPPSGDSQIIDIAVRSPHVYLADALAHRVLRLNLQTSTVSVVAGSGIQGYGGDGDPADRALLFQPGGVAVSADGRELFIADTKNYRVRRVCLLDVERSQ